MTQTCNPNHAYLGVNILNTMGLASFMYTVNTIVLWLVLIALV